MPYADPRGHHQPNYSPGRQGHLVRPNQIRTHTSSVQAQKKEIVSEPSVYQEIESEETTARK